MKHLIVPAVSALLLAGLAAQADAAAPQVLQLARNDRGDHHPAPGGAQSSPATVPAGAVTPTAGAGHGRGRHGGSGGTHATTGGATTGAATTGGATTGGATTGGANTTGGLFTGTGRRGGANATHGHGASGPATTGGLFTGTPAGHGPGGVTNLGGHAGTNVFGRRPSNWNRYPRTFDRGTYQRNFTAPRRYRWQTYNRPRGWYYRRWTYGQVLPSIFWANDYWLNDYWMFDLPIPPYGYVWVRYGDDALLVNRRTGEVLQVVYGLFD